MVTPPSRSHLVGSLLKIPSGEKLFPHSIVFFRPVSEVNEISLRIVLKNVEHLSNSHVDHQVLQLIYRCWDV